MIDGVTVEQIRIFVVNFASFITGAGIICAFALKIGKGVLEKQLAPFKEEMKKMDEARLEQHEDTKREIATLKEELRKNSLNTMKNTICNDNIPISERLMVGKEYIDNGGNGAVKIYLHNLSERYENQLKGENGNGR